MTAAVQLPLADPSEQPGKVRFGCVRLRCSTSVEWCGARSKRAKYVGQACHGCELGKGHEQHAGEPTPLHIRSKRAKAIADVDAMRHARVRERALARERRPQRPRRVLTPIEPGAKINLWTVVRQERNDANGKRRARFRCECGHEMVAQWSRMSGRHASKGCASCSAKLRNGRRMLTHDGRSQHLAAWAREKGMAKQTLLQRLTNGWSVERALTEPVAGHVQTDSPADRAPCSACGGPKDRGGKGVRLCSKCAGVDQ